MGDKKMVRCSQYNNCEDEYCSHFGIHNHNEDCDRECCLDDKICCRCVNIGEIDVIKIANIPLEQWVKVKLEEVVKNEEENKMIVQYIKDKKGKLGCLVGLSNVPGEYSIGWSKFNRSEEIGKFDKEKAKEIAIGRALNNTDMFEYSAFSGAALANFPASFANDISDFMERCGRYYHTDKGPTNFNWEK